MPFLRPTLPELVTRTQADLTSRLGLTRVPAVALVRVFATVWAGLAHGLHGHLAWVARQVLPDTAEGENLTRWAQVFGLRRKPASFASGVLTVKGTAGALVPAGAVWRTGDLEYVLDAAATPAPVLVLPETGSLDVPVVCRTAGPLGNRPAGTTLRLAVAAAGLQPNARGGEMAGGLPAESDDELSERLSRRLANPPQGGALTDYEAWATAVPGITRAWARTSGACAVTVLVVSDSGIGVETPSEAKLREVREFISQRRPATAQVLVSSPRLLRVPVALRISPDTPELRAAVEAALRLSFVRFVPGEKVYVSRIVAAAMSVFAMQNASCRLPAKDVEVELDAIPILGDLTWD